ncbi:hypothetical protein Tco_0252664 [Tanacetum coccineum]
MVVDEQMVLDMIVDDQLVLYMIDVVEEVDIIVVGEEMLKSVDYTVVGCTGDCCRMDASRIFSSGVRSAKVLSLIDAGVFGVGGTSTILN